MKKKNKTKNITLGQKILRYLWSFCIVMFLTGMCGLIVFIMLVNYWLKDVPELDTSIFKQVAQTSYIYDKNGNVLANYNDTENRDWVSISDIPPQLQHAFVAVEDQRFYTHPGFDIKRLCGAILNLVTGQDLYGGSTITQQLIKNTILTDDPTYKRKVQEIYLATELEKIMSKDEILEAYMNIIYLGGPNYGVKTAAMDYFNKDLSQLSLKECALIAGLTQNPYANNPRANMYSRNAFDRNEKRTKVVLKAMKKNGYITEEEYNEALKEQITIQKTSSSSSMYNYGHFVEYAVNDVIDGFLKYRHLDNTKENRQKIESEIRNKGYKIYTTLDVNAQVNLQNAISSYKNYPSYTETPKNLDYEIDPLQPQVAAVIIDQYTGSVIAMVGARTEPTVKKSFNRAIDSIMSIGSTIKPISVFGPALDMGLSPASIEYDFADSIEGYDLTNGYPKNSKTTNSPVSIRTSLAYSLNIPTARELCYHVGFETSSAYLTRLGIPSYSISETGSGLALGSSGINMLSLTAAYAAIANGGVYLEPRAYTVVTDSDGNVILNSADVKDTRAVYKKSTAYLLTDMLEDVITVGTGKKAAIPGITVAGKTGTNEKNSMTFAGYTGYYTSALWIGHDASIDFSEGIEAGDYVAPLWSNYMTKLHEGLQDKEIISSTDFNIVEATVCSVSGLLPTENCGDKLITDIFLEENVPTEYCQMHNPVKICDITKQIATDTCPSTKVIQGLFIPKDSELNNINHDLIRNYSQAVFEDEITVDGNSVCLVHTNDYITISNAKLNQAKNLSKNIKDLMESYNLNDSEIEAAEIHIKNLDYLVSNANRLVDAAATEQFSADFDKFYNKALDFYNKKLEKYEDIPNEEFINDAEENRPEPDEIDFSDILDE